jgi:hypothetical protein
MKTWMKIGLLLLVLLVVFPTMFHFEIGMSLWLWIALMLGGLYIFSEKRKR